MNPIHLMIVGGGLSGILLALKLSREKSYLERGTMMLVEQLPHLGGRLFTNSSGFEVFSPDSLQTLYRHLCSTLSEYEVNFVEDFIEQKIKNIDILHLKNDRTREERNLFIVRKHCTPVSQFLAGPNEVFTKKETEQFCYLINELFHLLNQHNNSVENENFDLLPFNKTSVWLSLSKPTKDSFSSFFTAIFGAFWEKAKASVVITGLNCYFEQFKKPTPDFFQKVSGLEIALEKVLCDRGVQVKTSCLVNRIEKISHNNSFKVFVSDQQENTRSVYNVTHLCMTAPIVSALTLLSKEFLSPQQSRFVSKIRPVSLVALEFHEFSMLKNDLWPKELIPGDRFLFPIERVQAHISSDQHKMTLFSYINFEDSLQAPAVREVIGRLRKAALRLFLPSAHNELKSGGGGGPFAQGATFTSTTGLKQRIVLLPTAYSTPIDTYLNVELSDIEARMKNLYFCGDSFSAYREPWSAIVNTTSQVCGVLSF
ncbi:MAG: NAD(P)/FAD-dependent oxidoreductase [Silvanigrellaceae bacterium]|nr:NAD(P)/FAD-dependent oxidoreductase [Silvanigrellaceae bacterium]